MRDFKLELELTVEKIYFICPPKISCRSDVFIKVELFNQIRNSDYFPAKFPLCLKETFRFNEFFFDSSNYFRILDDLYDIPFTMELFEYDYNTCKETRIAYFDSNAPDILQICSLNPVTINRRTICMVNKHSLEDFDPPMVVLSTYACLSQFSDDIDEICNSPPVGRPTSKIKRCCNSFPDICRSPSLSSCYRRSSARRCRSPSSYRSPSICDIDRRRPSPFSSPIRSPIRCTPPFTSPIVRCSTSPCSSRMRTLNRLCPSPCSSSFRSFRRQSPPSYTNFLRSAARRCLSPCSSPRRISRRQCPSPCSSPRRILRRRCPSLCSSPKRIPSIRCPSPCSSLRTNTVRRFSSLCPIPRSIPRCRSLSPIRICSSPRRRVCSPSMCPPRCPSPGYISPSLCSVSSARKLSSKSKYNACFNMEVSRLTKNLQEVSDQIRHLTCSQRNRVEEIRPCRSRSSNSLHCGRPVLPRWTI